MPVFQPLRIHSLLAHTMKFATFNVQGFGPDDACKASRNAEAFGVTPGADGGGTRYPTHRTDGRVEFYTMSTSLVNAAFATIFNLDENSPNGLGIGPLFIRNRLGSLVIEAEQAWVVKPADVEISVQPKVRTWILETVGLRMFPGS